MSSFDVVTGEYKRKNSKALLDPVDMVAYSIPCRKDAAGYREDAELQTALDNMGLELAREFAGRRYQSVAVAVLP